jgi:micrococcal nuclease
VRANKELLSWFAVYCALAACILLIVRPPRAEKSVPADVKGFYVERVVDGDTLVLSFAKSNVVTLRLDGIDAPEKGQPYYREAKAYLDSLVTRGAISVLTNGADRYKRTIATVYIQGTNINQQMIEAGMAWHYKRFNSDASMAKSEDRARASRAGLWREEKPTAPWDYRKRIPGL